MRKVALHGDRERCPQISCIIFYIGGYTMEIGEIVGRKIKAYRVRTGKTQRQFAMDAYMSASYISRFERGLVDNPTRATLEHLADTLGITLEELIRSENTDDSSRLESPKEKLGLNNPDFLKRYSDLSGAQQHRVYRIVGLLLGLNEP